MKQYEFTIKHKSTGARDQARATASSHALARAQIVLAYGYQYDIAPIYFRTYAPHEIAGEIDCSDFPDSDIEWLIINSRAIEA